MTRTRSIVRFADETISTDRLLAALDRGDTSRPPNFALDRSALSPPAKAAWSAIAVDDHAERVESLWCDGGMWVWLGPWFRAWVSADGSQVTYRSSGLAASVVDHLLVDGVFPLRLASRGRPAIHATAVAAGDRSFALLGASGAGKSTLTWALVRRGAAFVADDCVLFRVGGSADQDHAGGRALAEDDGDAWTDIIPTYPSTRLRPAAAVHAGMKGPANATGKHPVRFASARTEPVRLGALVILDRYETLPEQGVAPITVEPLRPLELLATLHQHRFSSGDPGPNGQRAVASLAAVADSVPGFRLKYPSDLGRLDDVAEAIERSMFPIGTT